MIKKFAAAIASHRCDCDAYRCNASSHEKSLANGPQQRHCLDLMAGNGPLGTLFFDLNDALGKVHVESFMCFPQEVKYLFLFLGNGGFGGSQKVYVEKNHVFFLSLEGLSSIICALGGAGSKCSKSRGIT